MASTVAEALGCEALLEDLGEPIAFLRRFQAVRPVFSPAAMTFLTSLAEQLRRRLPLGE